MFSASASSLDSFMPLKNNETEIGVCGRNDEKDYKNKNNKKQIGMLSFSLLLL
jgi:hypothetical protein